MRLLFIEDNPKLLTLVPEGLHKAGFTVDSVASVAEALAAVDAVTYDTVILDLGLPDGDGLSVLKHLRSQAYTTPLLILTARDALADRVDGLNRGADDYLVKPFAMEELIARVKALLRRPGGALGVVLQVGNVQFDTVAMQASVEGKPINLTRRELEVLQQLMRRAGNVVPKEVMEDRLYGFDEEVESNALEAHISRLRKRLAQYAVNVRIHTVRGVGYLLMAEGET